MTERLADKYEEVKKKQEYIMNRMNKVLHSFYSQLPDLSDSEIEIKKELQLIPAPFDIWSLPSNRLL